MNNMDCEKKDFRNIIEKQKEQKVVEWSENYEEAVADLIEKAKQGKCDSLSAIEEANKLFAIAKHGKVNRQEWSEEDEAMRKSILWVLESFVSKAESESSPSLITSYPTYYKEIDWLKSLRGRFVKED